MKIYYIWCHRIPNTGLECELKFVKEVKEKVLVPFN